jgi:DNA-binding transcriptional LysR family regulator
MVTYAAPSYLERFGAPQHPQEIEDRHQVVSYFSARSGRLFDFDFARGGEQFEIKGRQMVALNEASAYVTAVIAGLGVGQSPRFMVEPYLKSGQLRLVLPDWTPEPLPLHIVYPPNRHLSNKLRVFVDWIAGLFAAGS